MHYNGICASNTVILSIHVTPNGIKITNAQTKRCDNLFLFYAFENIFVSLELQNVNGAVALEVVLVTLWCCPTLSHCQLHPNFKWIARQTQPTNTMNVNVQRFVSVRYDCVAVVYVSSYVGNFNYFGNWEKMRIIFGAGCVCVSVGWTPNALTSHQKLQFWIFVLLLFHVVALILMWLVRTAVYTHSLTLTEKRRKKKRTNWTHSLIYVFYTQIIRFNWKRSDNWPFREPLKMTKINTKLIWRIGADRTVGATESKRRANTMMKCSFSRSFSLFSHFQYWIVVNERARSMRGSSAIKTIKSDRHGWLWCRTSIWQWQNKII